MTIRKRSMVMVMLFAISSVFYGAAKYYSSSLVFYVVEQTLIQKAPAGTNPVQLHERLHTFLAASPNQNAKMTRLLRISEYLEKVQNLTPVELNDLMAIEKY